MYTIQEHMHRFALWISARAAQRGVKGFKIHNLIEVFELTDFRCRVEFAIQNINTQEEFKKFHIEMCNDLIIKANLFFLLTYGRAAKILAMYLKTILINQFTHENQISLLIHPPIDRILLRNIYQLDNNLNYFGNINWTQLSEVDYWNMIEQIMLVNLPVNWMLEAYWHPQN